ncbi:response regulator [Labilibaculum euxinus]|uniref:histidine kinase n=1 Tax=Labilibaculum euxinus TaxID=2686357 RepID=A0A7M4D495_9BACT|nr:response regulator [Labilibaculum euxinus]MUP37474.1 response regulator [Labilibaculum euxinus]MVB06679.1 response regulator [Labilibaculum euxinus]
MLTRFTRFKDWKIKSKLLLLTLLTLLSILFLSLTSNYFFNTNKTLDLIINGVRVHQTLLQNATEELYNFKISKDVEHLEKSAEYLTQANHLAEDFIQINNDFTFKSDDEIANDLFKNFPEIYNNEINNARLLVNRLKILKTLNNSNIKDTRIHAKKTLDLVEKIKNELLTKRENINLDTTKIQLREIKQHYTEISSVLSNLAEKTNSALMWVMLGIALLLAITILLLSRYISKSISVPVQQMVNNFKLIAKGNFRTPLSINSKDEIGALANSFDIIQQDFQNVVNYTQKVAHGDLSVSLTPKSKEDELSTSLNQMVKTLKDAKTINDETSWFKSGVNQLNGVLQGDQNLNEVSDNSLIFMTEFLSAELGAIYVYQEEDKNLSLTASIGIPNKNQYKNIRLGHGLLGQVARTKKLKHVKDVPEDYFTIFSGTGEIKPTNIVIVPLIFNSTLWGVMELASIKKISESEIEFIKAVRESITVKIASTLARVRLENLLDTTQKQASELQVQQEELRVANEELAEQTKILIDNEKKLQVQQEELRVANEELEERTNQLEIQKDEIQSKNISLSQTHEKLETKARELEQTSQYKTDFLANMSHELRTPLNSLLILSNLLAKNKKGNLDDEDIESIEIINKSGKDLLQLINEILDLSKIEAGKMTVHFENLGSDSIAQEILMNFKHQAEKKKINFAIDIEEDFPKTIETDQLRLAQILKNLLSNAFKFTSKGTISVTMRKLTDQEIVRRDDLKEIETCAFVVTDTGVGIPDQKKDAIFEAFQQADGSTSRRYGGTGLGLSISKELSRMLGGEIHVESESGKGSTFTLLLPVKQSVKTVQNSALELQEKDLQPDEEKHIVLPLFIDDDRDIPHTGSTVVIIHPDKKEASLLYYQIHESSFHALAASNVEDAILLIEAHQPSAIIIGVELLMKNGETELDRLRSHPFASNLPIHIVNPVEGIREREKNVLPTVKATDFSSAIKKIQKELFSESKKILIVEDDSFTRKIIKTLLKSTNAEIEEVSTGIEAFKLIRENSYDCVILDLGLPDFTGNELLTKLSEANIIIPNTIIYTGKELSREEHRQLSKYTNSIILKGLKSDERLMDEVTLFLHHVATTIPDNPKIKVTEIDDSIFKGKKVLVVDDEIRNIFALGKILEDKEIEVFEAENGKIAVDVLKENKNVDLVLMDIMMPEMDGYEAMTIIRKTPGIKNIPIICLTAKAMKEDYEKAILSGANDYLSKPIDENKLFSMLKIWLYN